MLCAHCYAIGHDPHSGTGKEQQAMHNSDLMIAAILKKHETELEEVQKEKSFYERKCDKLEEELEGVKKKVGDKSTEVKFEELESCDVQKCKYNIKIKFYFKTFSTLSQVICRLCLL